MLSFGSGAEDKGLAKNAKRRSQGKRIIKGQAIKIDKSKNHPIHLIQLGCSLIVTSSAKKPKQPLLNMFDINMNPTSTIKFKFILLPIGENHSLPVTYLILISKWT